MPSKLDYDLFVAAARAIETRHDEPLIEDPFASALVMAAGNPLSIAYMETPVVEPPVTAPELFHWTISRLGAAIDRNYDDQLLRAADAGVRQIVLVGAGLDTRAYRLSWPSATTVYELDYLRTFTFKDPVMAMLGAQPRCQRAVVHADADTAWPTSLCAKGFDPDEPSAWLIAEILIGLTPKAQDYLLERVIELSAPGSWIITDHDIVFGPQEMWHSLADAFLPEPIRAANPWMLFYPGERTPPSAWLAGHGWRIASESSGDIAERYGRSFPVEKLPVAAFHAARRIMTATLPKP
ncbi:hypothetical protein BI330_12170 [Mycobacterium sp. CBMA 623]|nr:hypothetical protein [Mycobacteroides sp. CBMA 326]